MFRRAPESQTFDQIRLRLLAAGLLGGNTRSATVLLTSRRQGDGVSTIVAGLAKSAGTAWPGRVLVLDVDETRERVGDRLHGNVPAVSIHDVLSNHEVVEDKIITDPALGIDILALNGRAGTTGDDARSLLQALSSRYQVVFVDVGAMFGPGAHAWLGCDGAALMVVDSTSTTVPALERVRSEVDQSNFELAGFILNRRRFPIPAFLYRWLN